MPTLKGKFRISNASDGSIRIVLEDAISGQEIVCINTDRATFAEAVFNRFTNECTFELSNLDLLGKRKEWKIEKVRIKILKGENEWDTANREKIKKRSLKPFEIDGWLACDSDFYNSHKRYKDESGEVYNVHFTRFVDVPTKE